MHSLEKVLQFTGAILKDFNVKRHPAVTGICQHSISAFKKIFQTQILV